MLKVCLISDTCRLKKVMSLTWNNDRRILNNLIATVGVGKELVSEMAEVQLLDKKQDGCK